MEGKNLRYRGAPWVLGIVGRLLVAAGAVVLLFAGYQLWGTGLAESRAQQGLENDFTSRLGRVGTQSTAALEALARQQADHRATTSTAPTGNGSAAAAATSPPAQPQELIDQLYPSPGEPVARILIPSISVDKVVVEGVDLDDLRKGPGHFPDTPLPGQEGNAAIAGHRTTYGAPFGDLDKLKPGDEIRVSTVLGEAVYKVAGTRIVDPEEVEVVGDFGDNRLTLTACHPKFSAAQRIIVWADLQGEPLPTVARPDDRRTVDITPTVPASNTPTSVTTASSGTATSSGAAVSASTSSPEEAGSEGADSATASTIAADANSLAGDPGAWPGTIGWGLATLLAALAALVMAWRVDLAWGPQKWRRRGIYVLSSPLWLGSLFVCFSFVDRLLPAY